MATNGALVAIMAAQRAAIAAAERDMVTAFRVGDATRPERARTLEELGVKHGGLVTALVERGWVREAGPGLFWLDERKVAEPSRAGSSGLKVALVVTAIATVVLVALALYLSLRAPR